ncbi:hypothetical protein CHH78_10330 [Shouchella clausii]|jgi:hypothetical protein|uniref:DUF6602 domain-containing protein n=1 Tax=Shouchella clausii TaxID=79880 RepID=UPI000BA607F7|nr:DUF6602 domain-containing protein [Shouchella clausii]MBU8596057.1 hypothetical protein [Shouchella clausii]MCY1103248.1 hypothetical protein [Shouchella clausii]MED4158720.1 hypothetical protein [Shouchella clausii]MED4176483.1 hypothetical protein [Shouchella clausii]PAD08948.1 hypothetical protein CHH76_11870 [Shouchella clausii]
MLSEDKENVFKQIYKNYIDMNKMMINELDLATAHDGLTGNYREEMWVKFFRGIIPMKYSIAQGVIIIDSKGRRSNEVDIAVYDEQYTPYVFQYNTLKFIPIEAVAVVIECKSQDWNKDELRKWSCSIKKLEPVRTGVARIVSGYATGLTNTVQTRTRPIHILASIHPIARETTFQKVKQDLGAYFDFIICQQKGRAKNENREFKVLVKNEGKTLSWWGDELNKASAKKDCEDKKEEKERNDRSKYLELQFINNKTEKKKILDIANKEKLTDEWLNEKYDELEFKDLKLTNTLKKLNVEGNQFLTLNLQLNQLLMLINNPMWFPHFAYAKRFEEVAKEIAEES